MGDWDPDRHPTDDDNWEWLKSTTQLQSDVYGYDLMAMAHAAKVPPISRGSALPEYLDWNVTAAVQELAELREEFSWKPWATDRPFVNRDRIIQESVDVLHFVGNILTALGADDAEFWQAYQAKQKINVKRATSGSYSAQKGGLAHGSD